MLLTIRQAQFDQMQRESDIRWYDQQLAGLYPGFADASSAQRREWIDAGLRRASRFGLQRADCFQFLCFEQTFTPGTIDEASFAWARDILQDRESKPTERMKRLRQESIKRLLDAEALEEQTTQLQLANDAYDALDASDHEVVEE